MKFSDAMFVAVSVVSGGIAGMAETESDGDAAMAIFAALWRMLG